MFRSISKKEKGQGLVEYALILVLIAIVVIVGVTQLGTQVEGVFETVNDSLGGGAGEGEVAEKEPQGQDFGFSGAVSNLKSFRTQQESEDRFCEVYPSYSGGYNIYDTGTRWQISGNTDPEIEYDPPPTFVGTGSCP